MVNNLKKVFDCIRKLNGKVTENLFKKIDVIFTDKYLKLCYSYNYYYFFVIFPPSS